MSSQSPFSCLLSLYRMFSYKQKKGFLFIQVMIIFMSIAEVIGIASLAPFMALVSNPDLIQTNQVLQTVYYKMHFQSHKDFIIVCGIGAGLLILFGNLFAILTV